MSTARAPRPSRLHHHAYVSADLEATRVFYEDVVGLPLVATWCEAGGDAHASLARWLGGDHADTNPYRPH